MDAGPLADAIGVLGAEPNLAAAGFTVRLHNGRACGYGMRFPSYASFVLGQNLSARWDLLAPNNSPWQTTENVRWRICDVVFTSPLLIRRAAWKQTGGLDAQAFPFSDSDVDWAWRCAKLGWKLAVINSDNVVHDNLKQLSAWSATRVVDFHRSRLRALRRHRGNVVGLFKPLLFLRHCAEAVILALRSKSDPAAREKLAIGSECFEPFGTTTLRRVRHRQIPSHLTRKRAVCEKACESDAAAKCHPPTKMAVTSAEKPDPAVETFEAANCETHSRNCRETAADL